MIRFVTLSILASLALLTAVSGLGGSFGGIALLAVGVSAFGLLVGLCTQILRES